MNKPNKTELASVRNIANDTYVTVPDYSTGRPGRYKKVTCSEKWNVLVTQKNGEDGPTVEFYDATQSVEKFGENGQFVAAYHLATIMGIKNQGLDLCGYEDVWKMSWAAIEDTQKSIRLALAL